MTVFFWGGVSSRTGSQQTKASAARIAPILIPKGWKNAAAYPMRCGTKPRSTLLRQASAGGDFGPRGDKRRNGFPNDGVSRLDPAVRKKSGSIPAPRRIPRWTAAPPSLRRTGSCGGGSGFRIYQTFRQKVAGSQLSTPAPRRTPRETAAPTLCSAAPDRAAEATYQYSSVTDRGNRMGRAAASPNLKLLLEKETRRCRRPKLSASDDTRLERRNRSVREVAVHLRQHLVVGFDVEKVEPTQFVRRIDHAQREDIAQQRLTNYRTFSLSPNEQSRACASYAVARKRLLKTNEPFDEGERLRTVVGIAGQLRLHRGRGIFRPDRTVVGERRRRSL